MATDITVTEDVTNVTVTESTTAIDISPQVTSVGVSAVDITAANIASSISLNPTGGISATNVQAGFNEIASEVAFLSGATFTGGIILDKDVSTAYDPSADDAQRDNTNTLLLKNEDGTENSFAQVAFDLANQNQPIARIAAINRGSSSSALAFVVEGNNAKTEAMRIDESANVGIGTNDPQQKLDVNGNIRVQGTYPKIEFVDTNNNPDFTLIGGNGAVQFYDETNSTSRLYVASNGKVGIGTDDPSGSLHISDAFPKILMQDTDGTNQIGEFYHQNGTTAISARNDTTNGSIVFQRYDGTTATNSMRIDTSGNVGIGTNSPEASLHLKKQTQAKLIIEGDSDNDPSEESSLLELRSDGGAVKHTIGIEQGQINDLVIDSGNGTANYVATDIVFKTKPVDTATTQERMRITDEGDVGIGVAIPNEKLDVAGNIAVSGTVDGRDIATDGNKLDGIEALATADQTDAEIKTAYENNANTNAFTDADHTKLDGIEELADVTDATNVADAGAVMDTDFTTNGFMKRTGSGSYTVDTNTYLTSFDITDQTDPKYLRSDEDDTTTGTITAAGLTLGAVSYPATDGTANQVIVTDGSGTLSFADQSGGISDIVDDTTPQLGGNLDLNSNNITGTGVMQVASAAQTSPSYSFNSDNNTGMYQPAADKIGFSTAGSEKMRINTAGNVSIGTTDEDYKLHVNYTKSSDSTVGLHVSYNTASYDGRIITFGEDVATSGGFGKADGFGLTAGYVFGASTVGLRFETTFGQSPRITPCDDDGVLTDDTIDLGSSAARYQDIYASNTSIIASSDRNLKQDIETLTDAEQRVAVACKGLLRKFRWISAVEEKGDDARIHFGIMAQDLQDAFTAEGLDAGRYGMFISSTWWEHEGKHYPTAESAPEGATEITRLGVRYAELLAFIISTL